MVREELRGKLVHVTFYDHVSGEARLARCTVTGRVLEVTPEHVVIAWWEILTSDDVFKRGNDEVVTLIQATILEVVELRPRKVARRSHP